MCRLGATLTCDGCIDLAAKDGYLTAWGCTSFEQAKLFCKVQRDAKEDTGAQYHKEVETLN